MAQRNRAADERLSAVTRIRLPSRGDRPAGRPGRRSRRSRRRLRLRDARSSRRGHPRRRRRLRRHACRHGRAPRQRGRGDGGLRSPGRGTSSARATRSARTVSVDAGRTTAPTAGWPSASTSAGWSWRHVEEGVLQTNGCMQQPAHGWVRPGARRDHRLPRQPTRSAPAAAARGCRPARAGPDPSSAGVAVPRRHLGRRLPAVAASGEGPEDEADEQREGDRRHEAREAQEDRPAGTAGEGVGRDRDGKTSTAADQPIRARALRSGRSCTSSQ